MKPVILIPAYQPAQELIALIRALTEDADQKIIVVNDGSTQPTAKQVFDTISAQFPRVDLVHHAVNLGKGQALKTGFNHFLLHYGETSPGVVTADADGQHAKDDILLVAQSLAAQPHKLILGSRSLKEKVPWRSLVGNKITIQVFRMITGVKLIDTQTGLRGIPQGFLGELMRSIETGYDFELDMLIRAVQQGYPIREIPIKTIYMDNNKSSHFDAIRDSFKIYFVFLRFSLLSMVTAAIDYIVFALTLWLSKT